MIKPLFENRLSKIEDLLYQAQEVYMAVSFVKISGLALIRPVYLSGNRLIKIIVDTKQNITERAALKQLLDDGVQVKRYSDHGAYHPKVWLFRIDDAWIAVVGSTGMQKLYEGKNITSQEEIAFREKVRDTEGGER